MPSPRRQGEDAAAAQAQIRGIVDSKLSGSITALLDACDADVFKWGLCPHCHRKVQVDYPDYRGRTDAITGMFKLGYGNPQSGESGGGSFVVNRVIVKPEGVDDGDGPAAGVVG